MQTNEELLRFHQVLTKEDVTHEDNVEIRKTKPNTSEHKQITYNTPEHKQITHNDDDLKSESSDANTTSRIAPDMFQCEEPCNGIEFDSNEQPPIYVTNGKGTVCINKNIVQCQSGNINVTTFKTNIALQGGKYYFEIKLKTNGKIFVGLADSQFDENPSKHSWMVNARDLSNQEFEEMSDKAIEMIIGLAVDFDDKKCHLYMNGNIITPQPFNAHNIPFIKPLYPIFLLGANQCIDIFLFDNMKFYTKQFKDKSYDLLPISNVYFNYIYPQINIGIGEFIDIANQKEESKLDEEPADKPNEKEEKQYQIHPIHVIEGKTSFCCNYDNGLICTSLTDSSTFAVNFQMPKAGKCYFEIKIENIQKNDKNKNEIGWISCHD
eukprot:283580_1